MRLQALHEDRRMMVFSRPSVWTFSSLMALFMSLISLSVLDAQVVKRIPDQPLSIEAIEVVGAKVWLGTPQGAYRVDGETAKRIPDEALFIRAIKAVGAKVWLGTALGAYRISP